MNLSKRSTREILHALHEEIDPTILHRDGEASGHAMLEELGRRLRDRPALERPSEGKEHDIVFRIGVPFEDEEKCLDVYRTMLDAARASGVSAEVEFSSPLASSFLRQRACGGCNTTMTLRVEQWGNPHARPFNTKEWPAEVDGWMVVARRRRWIAVAGRVAMRRLLQGFAVNRNRPFSVREASRSRRRSSVPKPSSARAIEGVAPIANVRLADAAPFPAGRGDLLASARLARRLAVPLPVRRVLLGEGDRALDVALRGQARVRVVVEHGVDRFGVCVGGLESDDAPSHRARNLRDREDKAPAMPRHAQVQLCVERPSHDVSLRHDVEGSA